MLKVEIKLKLDNDKKEIEALRATLDRKFSAKGITSCLIGEGHYRL